MGTKRYKPRTPSQRLKQTLDFAEITTTKPEKQHALLKLLTLQPATSNRAAAKLIRVSDTTVARWKANLDFKKTLSEFRKLLAQGIEIE